MQLDRDSIVRRDFPPERRGYDRAAVDAHLDAVAVAVAELIAARAETGAAGSISTKVASIVAAAEEAAQKIEADAAERARAHDARVAAAAQALLERIDALRSGVEQLAGGLIDAAAPLPSSKSGNGAHDAAAAFVATADAGPVGTEAAAAAEVDKSVAGEPPPAAAETAASDSSSAARSTVVEDARLVALQMLLEGTSRDEVDAYLAEHFDLPDQAALLDDVAAAVGG